MNIVIMEMRRKKVLNLLLTLLKIVIEIEVGLISQPQSQFQIFSSQIFLEFRAPRLARRWQDAGKVLALLAR